MEYSSVEKLNYTFQANANGKRLEGRAMGRIRFGNLFSALRTKVSDLSVWIL